MTKSDPFGFDMSVRSAKKKNPRGRRGMSGASETSTRICDHEGCQEAGKFRAPKALSASGQRRLLRPSAVVGVGAASASPREQ